MLNNLIITIFIVLYSTSLMAQWSEINDGLNRGNVNALFSKDQEWVISTKSGGFYKSIDLGASWKISNTKSLSWIIPNIINSNDTLFYVDNFPNLNISTDFSNSWVIKTIPFQSDNPYYLAYFYKNIYLSLKSHLLISNDLGNSWIDKTNSNISSPFFIEKIDSNILLANRNSIYLCDKNLNNCNPIYLNNLSYISFLKVFDNDIYTSSSGNLIKSSNYGVDWDTIVKSKFGINRFFKSENLIVLVTDSLLISIDNGNNWINLPPLYPKHIINSIKKIDNNIYFSTESGLFQLELNNEYKITNLNNGIHNVGFINKTINNSEVFFWTALGHIYEKLNNNDEFSYLATKWKNYNFDTCYSFSVYKNGNNILNSTDKGLFISKNNGDNWIIPDNNFCKTASVGFEIEPSVYLFCFKNKGIIKTPNFGDTWVECNNGILNLKDINSLFKTGDNLITLSKDSLGNKCIYLSIDKGLNWGLDTNLNFLTSTSINNFSEKCITYSAFKRNINYTTDLGKSWITKPTTFYPYLIYQYKNSFFVISQTDGIYLSTNMGDTWKNITIDLPTSRFYDVFVLNEDIYALSSYGNYTAKLSDFGLSDINEPTTENQNYLYAYPAFPVPSNTGFVKSLIYWDTSIDIDKAKITITNLNGEIINNDPKLSIEKNNNFNGNLIWDCRNMPSGAYFIKIEHGSALVTLKVMVD